MRNLIIFSSLFTLFAFHSIAQQEITLEDAVMQQYRKFAPKSLFGFQWIPGTNQYTYLEQFRTLKKGDVKKVDLSTIITIDELNTKLGAELAWFSGFNWKDQASFYVNDGLNFYRYDTREGKGYTLFELPEEAENSLFNETTEYVAYTKANNVYLQTKKGVEIAVTNNADKNIVSGQAIARSEFGITGGLFWSKDGNSLAFYQKDETDVHDYPLLDISETPGELMSIKYPMAGQKSERPKVGIYSVANKSVVYFSPRNGADNYLTNLSWTPDSKYVVIAEVNRDQDHMWLDVFEASTGKYVKTLFEEKSPTWIEPEHPAFFPLDNSNNFIWISEKSGFNNLYYYDFEGKLIKQLTNHDFVVKDIMEINNGKVYYTTTGESPLQTHVRFVDLKGKAGILTRASGSHHVDISTDGKLFHDQFSSHSVPNNEWIIGSNGKIINKLLESENPYNGYTMGTAEISHITGVDGTRLYTRLIKPSNFDPTKKYPVLVYVYGGPHAQLITDSWLDGASLWMYWMAEQGYLVYTLDNRGSAERGVAFESQIHRQLGTVEMEDQLSGVEFLKSLPYVDGNRIAVHGWSFGGFMTTSLMLRAPGVFTTGVAGGPVTDWKYYEIMYGERYMDRPEQNPRGYEQSSLMTHAEHLEGDLLLIHGTVDDVVVMQHNLALVRKFVDLGIQMDFFPYPMHKHNVRGKDRVHLMDKVLNYVIEHNQ